MSLSTNYMVYMELHVMPMHHGHACRCVMTMHMLDGHAACVSRPTWSSSMPLAMTVVFLGETPERLRISATCRDGVVT